MFPMKKSVSLVPHMALKSLELGLVMGNHGEGPQSIKPPSPMTNTDEAVPQISHRGIESGESYVPASISVLQDEPSQWATNASLGVPAMSAPAT